MFVNVTDYYPPQVITDLLCILSLRLFSYLKLQFVHFYDFYYNGCLAQGHKGTTVCNWVTFALQLFNYCTITPRVGICIAHRKLCHNKNLKHAAYNWNNNVFLHKTVRLDQILDIKLILPNCSGINLLCYRSTSINGTVWLSIIIWRSIKEAYYCTHIQQHIRSIRAWACVHNDTEDVLLTILSDQCSNVHVVCTKTILLLCLLQSVNHYIAVPMLSTSVFFSGVWNCS